MPSFFAEAPSFYENTKKRISKATDDESNARYLTEVERSEQPWFNTEAIYGQWDPSQKSTATKADEEEGTRNEVIFRSGEQLHRHLNLPLLSTEDIAKETIGLAELAQDDATLPQAAQACLQTDIRALNNLLPLLQHEQVLKMVVAIKKTLESGGKIFLAGCGSSGRLGVLLEILCKELFPEYKEQFVSLMAGGDFAVVRAIENFEDSRAYALRQLQIQEFDAKKDLFIGNSASGGAPFINAQISFIAERVKSQVEKSHLKPWLVLCNDLQALPDIHNPDAEFLELDVGPNALSGSSRMQSATVTQIGIYTAIVNAVEQLRGMSNAHDDQRQQIDLLLHYLQDSELHLKLAELVQYEAGVYQAGNRMVYEIENPIIAVTAFTDMTERAPTFGERKPENQCYEDELNPEKAARITVSILGAETAEQGQSMMLGRAPICLEMHEEPKTRRDIMLGFDFSENAAAIRARYLTNCEQKTLRFSFSDGQLSLDFDRGTKKIEFSFPGLTPVFQQTFIKMLLNTHSTLVMGRLGKFYSNTMLGVNLGNAKLFARVVRYVKAELEERFPGLNKLMRIPGYVSPIEKAIALVVAENKLNEKMLDGPIVKKTVERILAAVGINEVLADDISRSVLQRLKTTANEVKQFKPMKRKKIEEGMTDSEKQYTPAEREDIQSGKVKLERRWISNSLFKEGIKRHLEAHLQLRKSFEDDVIASVKPPI